MTNKIKRFFWNIISGNLPTDYDLEALRKIILMNLIMFLGSFFLLLLGILAIIQRDFLLGTVDITILSIIIFLFLYLRKTKNHNVVGMIGTIAVGFFYFFLVAYGGASKAAYVWAFTYPLISLFLVGTKIGTLTSFLLLCMVSTVFVFGTKISYFSIYSSDLSIRFVSAYITIHLCSYIMEKVRSIFQDRLKATNTEIEKVLEKVQEKSFQLAEANEELHQEISERRKVEKAMRESEERYRSLVENTMEGYFISDIPSGRFLFLNQRSCDIYGYTLEEGLKLTIWDVISAEDHERVQTRIKKRMEGKRVSSERQIYTSVLKDGSTIQVEISTSLITFQGGSVVQGVIRDITKQKRLERQLEQSKKMEAIGLLAGGVAHDLNNVLSGIVSYPDLIIMDLPEDSPLRKPIQTIQNSGQKAAEIVQDLLTLARRGVSTKSVINLNDTILDYLKSPENEKLVSVHPNVSLKTDLDQNLLNIEGSSVQLIKMIMNLVSNSAEAQPTGGEIAISTYNQYIDTPIQGYEEVKEGDFIVLDIKDNGLGIATEDLNRIFEPFYTKKVMGRSGTGLGMAVVWGTVHDHDGYIDIKSTEGVGTKFSLFFPVMREKITNKEFVPVEEYLGNKEKILVIDDIVEQREIAASILSKLNYSVTTVSSGEKAVTHLKDNSVEILILDMIMEPGIDGLETYRRIKKHHPNQKAIIASGYSETSRVKEAQRLGAGKYIRKPYTLEKIGIAVKDELKK
jgi:two-component system, cell cycle sensor histidine kinase and response regulator CckA